MGAAGAGVPLKSAAAWRGRAGGLPHDAPRRALPRRLPAHAPARLAPLSVRMRPAVDLPWRPPPVPHLSLRCRYTPKSGPLAALLCGACHALHASKPPRPCGQGAAPSARSTASRASASRAATSAAAAYAAPPPPRRRSARAPPAAAPRARAPAWQPACVALRDRALPQAGQQLGHVNAEIAQVVPHRGAVVVAHIGARAAVKCRLQALHEATVGKRVHQAPPVRAGRVDVSARIQQRVQRVGAPRPLLNRRSPA
jgi:hypothetical protein